MATNKQYLSDEEKQLALDALSFACHLANSLQIDLEENPESVSDTTYNALQSFREKMNALTDALDVEPSEMQ